MTPSIATLSAEASARLRQGNPWAHRGDVLSFNAPTVGFGAAILQDPAGQALGVADVDLDSVPAVRRLGLPEDTADAVIPKQLRRAIGRRALLGEDPRYCRLANDEGDGLPGLVIDRFEDHFVVRTHSRSMDARAQSVARALVELAGARSVLLSNDHVRRIAAGLPRARPHVLLGAPPRWTRVPELGARLTADLYGGEHLGHAYDRREVRRWIRRLAVGARVLDPRCGTGADFVHAGLGGARQILAFGEDGDAIELARENAEANGLSGRTRIERTSSLDGLSQHEEPFDLVLLDYRDLPKEELDACIRHTRHGGRLVAMGSTALELELLRSCEEAGRPAFCLSRLALPLDFPTVLGAADAWTGLVVELS